MQPIKNPCYIEICHHHRHLVWTHLEGQNHSQLDPLLYDQLYTLIDEDLYVDLWARLRSQIFGQIRDDHA